jgi:5,10-methenyltetrahydromethanopterin hydrogenase
LDNVDPHIREVVNAACEELPLPARANGEHAIAIVGKEEVDKCSRPEQDCC